jgi:hypothetical protein
LVLMFGFGLFGVACSGNTPTHTDAGAFDGGSAIGRSCNVDIECGNLRCDLDRHQCICLADSDCTDPKNPFCDNFTGLCVANVSGCSDSSGCLNGQYCNPDTRACEDVRAFCATCDADIQCGQGGYCVTDDDLQASFCSTPCTTDTDCVHGASCQDLLGTGTPQLCWTNIGSNCKNFTGCVPDSLASCDDTHPCTASGQVCDTGLGVCKAQQQICPLGTVCDPTAHVCVNSCSVDQDCSNDGSLVCVNGACIQLNQCQSDDDCPADRVCSLSTDGSGTGSCVPFCNSGPGCAPGAVCEPRQDASGNTRYVCLQGCLHNSDCPISQLCLDQNGNIFSSTDPTQLGGCSSTYQNAQACQGTLACNPCQLCGSGNTCTSAASGGYCVTCNPNPTSGTNDCINQGFAAGSECVSVGIRDSSGNVIGSSPFFCGIPCGSNNSIDQSTCPAGFVCAASSTSGQVCVPSDSSCTYTTGQFSGQAKCQ